MFAQGIAVAETVIAAASSRDGELSLSYSLVCSQPVRSDKAQIAVTERARVRTPILGITLQVAKTLFPQNARWTVRFGKPRGRDKVELGYSKIEPLILGFV
jgi:hypothetical protein